MLNKNQNYWYIYPRYAKAEKGCFKQKSRRKVKNDGTVWVT